MAKEIVLILDNIRSTFNVGAIFRTADASSIKKIYLCGITPTPPNPKILKVSLGAESYISWEKVSQTYRLIEKLKKDGYHILALEQSKKSLDIFKFKPKYPIALVLGSEVKGLSKNILKRADKIIEIPMFGRKESLNVAVALGICVYQIIGAGRNR